MADLLKSSKIDGFVQVGASDATLPATKVDGFIMVGASAGTLVVSKIDSFTMVGSSPPATHSRVVTGMWVGKA